MIVIMWEYMSHIQIETTFEKREDAEKLVDILLDNNLIACAHFCDITAVYVWEGKRYKDPQVLLKVNTQEILYHDCEKLIKKNHPDKVPHILVTQANGSKEYLSWIDGSVKQKSKN